MRSIPSTASIRPSSSANPIRLDFGRSRPKLFTFCPSSVSSRTPSAASLSASATSSSGSRLTSLPRVEGTMQYAQTRLHPCEICSHPWNSRSLRLGRCPEKSSNSKYPCAVSESELRNSASLWICPGPNATSTKGNRSNTSSFTDCAQQPPTPTIRSGTSDFNRFASPRWAMNRLSADSRIEQVLNRIRSA